MQKKDRILCLRLEDLKKAESNRPFSEGKTFGQNEEFTLEKYFLANCLAIFFCAIFRVAVRNGNEVNAT